MSESEQTRIWSRREKRAPFSKAVCALLGNLWLIHTGSSIEALSHSLVEIMRRPKCCNNTADASEVEWAVIGMLVSREHSRGLLMFSIAQPVPAHLPLTLSDGATGVDCGVP